MKFLQLNLGRGEEAQNLLMQTAKERGADVLLISEQHKWFENSAWYLKRFKKRDNDSCRYCGSLVENAEHTLFICARWGAEREAVGRAVGAQLTPDTIVSLMLQSEQIWMLVESFVTLVMKTRELDGRAERGNNGGQ